MKQLLLVIGCSRSGTTLLSQVLSQHSEVFISPETHFFSWVWGQRRLLKLLPRRSAAEFVARSVVNAEYPKTSKIFEEHLKSIADSYSSGKALEKVFTDFLMQLSDKATLGEKTPLHTPLAKSLLPKLPINTKVLAICRRPEAVVASSMNFKRLRGASTLSSATARWLYMNRKVLELQSLLPKSRFFLLRFEDLLENPDDHIEHITQWLNLDFENEMLETPLFRDSSHSSSELSPLSGDSLERWRKVLSTSQSSLIGHSCRKLAKELGYELEENQPLYPDYLLFEQAVAIHIAKYRLAKSLMQLGIYPAGALVKGW